MKTKGRSGFFVILGGIVIVLILMAIHGTLHEQPKLQTKSFITIGIQNNPIIALLVVAQEEGFYEQYGIHVKLISFPSGKLALNAMLSHKVDIAASSDIPILIHAFKNENFSIIATINRTESMQQVVIHKNREISAPADLAGKRIATQLNSGADYYTYLFLKHYNIPISQVQLVYMPVEKMVTALRSGYIHAFVMRSPYVQLAQRYMPGAILLFHVPDLYQVRFNLVVSHHGLRLHTKQVSSVLAALKQALQFTRLHPVKAQGDVIHFFGLGRRKEILSLWSHYDFTVDLGDDLVKSLQQQAQWVIATGKGMAARMPDMTKLIDPKPLQMARQSEG